MNLTDDGGRSAIGLTSAKARYEYLPDAFRARARRFVSGIGGKCGPDPTSRKLEAFRTLLSSTKGMSNETNNRRADHGTPEGDRGSYQNGAVMQELQPAEERRALAILDRFNGIFDTRLRAAARWTARSFGHIQEFRSLLGVRMGDHHVFGIAIPINPYERSKPIRDRKYLAFVRSLPCLVCCSIRRVEAAHFGPHGLGQKSSDLSAIPLCCLHHRKGPHSIHALGPVRFQEQHRLDIRAMIEKLNQFYWRTRKAA